MHIGSVDESATLGRSWIHTASPITKLSAFALILAATVVSWNLLVLAGLLILLVAVATTARLKPGLAYTLAAYPALFAGVFAFASAPDVLTGLVIIMKAAVAGLAAVSVILTTPYPQVFAPIQRIVPGIVGDALLMTYRSTFLLLDKFANLLTAIRLRAGLRGGHPVRTARATSQALGGLLLYSFDLSQRDYDVMRLRGYQDRLKTSLPRSTAPIHDAFLVVAAALALATSVLWRIAAATLNPFSWIVLFLPLVALVAAVLTSRRAI